MNIDIKRNFVTYDYEENQEVIQLDEATLDEIKQFRGKVCGEGEIKSNLLIKFLHDDSVGKICDHGDNRFVKCLRLGELEISMQLSYRLFSLRCDLYPGYFSSFHCEGEEFKLMTEDEFMQIFSGEDPSETYIDVFIYNNVNGYEYQRATQMKVWEVDNFLRGIVYEHEMNCKY